jgi:hypothetical protein
MKSTWPRRVADAVQAVTKGLMPSAPRPRSRDPFYSDLARRRAINARREGRHSWLGDTRGWLLGRREHDR